VEWVAALSAFGDAQLRLISGSNELERQRFHNFFL
jgi:hypothetical protein